MTQTAADPSTSVGMTTPTPTRERAEVERAEYGPKLGRLSTIVATALGAYHLWTGYSGGLRVYRQRGVHLIGGILVLSLIAIEQ